MAKTEEFVLYSDGGGEKQSAAAGACIVERAADNARVRIVAFLGPGTNNEAEIVGGLLGFSFLNLLDCPPRTPLRWICDSEYVLKSATGYIHGWQKNGWKTAGKSPVKNQGLWRAFLLLSGPFSIEAEHVRGHTGHPENEACDRASTWAMANGESALEGGDAALVEIDTGSGPERWLLIDGRGFLSALRGEAMVTPSEEQCLGLVSAIEASGVRNFSASGEPRAVRPNLKPQALAQLKRLADKCSPHAELQEIAADLLAVLQKHQQKLADREGGRSEKRQKKRC